MTALEQAYASNTETLIPTFEFSHSAITGGTLRLAQSYFDLTATLETGGSATFLKSGIGFSYPAKTTEGRQDLNIQLDNVSNEVWAQIINIVRANRAGSEEKATCKLRTYLPSDLSAPSGAIYNFTVMGSSINMRTAAIRAAYSPIPDVSYPRGRYYPTNYPGLKYV